MRGPVVPGCVLSPNGILHETKTCPFTTTEQLKRLDSSTKPPIFSHFQETLDGLSSVQAYRIENRMRQKNFFVVDANMRARLAWDATNR